MKKATHWLNFAYIWINRCKKSLTIKFNGLMLVAFQIAPYVSDALPTIKEYLTTDIYKWLFLSVVAANILLRFKTDKALKDK